MSEHEIPLHVGGGVRHVLESKRRICLTLDGDERYPCRWPSIVASTLTEYRVKTPRHLRKRWWQHAVSPSFKR